MNSLHPKSSPGEVAALSPWATLLPVLVALGVDPVKASAIAGFISAAAPYVVKIILAYRDRPKG